MKGRTQVGCISEATCQYEYLNVKGSDRILICSLLNVVLMNRMTGDETGRECGKYGGEG